MKIGILGINHKSGDLKLREELTQAFEKRLTLWALPFSYVLLSTCNRTEIYFSSSDPAITHTFLLGILRSELQSEFEHKIYSYFGKECFAHLAKVVSGFDSALIGETEIQGQVKKAYQLASTSRFLFSELHFLFQKCLKIGKEIRQKNSSKFIMPHLSEILSKIVTAHFLTSAKILFIGISEINLKMFRKLKAEGYVDFTFCNRSLGKVNYVKDEANILSWEERKKWKEYDLLIFGTKSPFYLLQEVTFADVEERKMVIDLSVPRNVDPKVGRNPLVTLLNIDQLNKAVDLKCRKKAALVALSKMPKILEMVTKQINIYQNKENYQPLELLSEVI